ncbi:MAG: diphthine--ammonia ligase [Planctomycetes bacterium]|nr:diphthine--ammonia ligase [Planctomycetota bacterium]
MYISSWSGGKDSCLACYKAIQSGYRISHLVNFISAEFKRVSFHGTPAKLVQRQADAIGIPLLQKEAHPEDYEPSFKEAVNQLRMANGEWGIKNSESRIPNSALEGMVFGDIYLQEHRQWTTRVCNELGIQAIEMLWGMRTEDILDEFIGLGFKSLIISAKASLIGKEWVGKLISHEFINYLKNEKPHVDICGENGEYHTFVFDGPLFKKPVKVAKQEVIEKETPYGKWYFLDME